MHRDEALKLLRGGSEGIAEWNRRRSANKPYPNLDRVDLSRCDLNRVDLACASLAHSKFNHATLAGARLEGAHLFCASFQSAYLSGANLCGANLESAVLSRASLLGAALRMAELRDATLMWANLTQADLSHADLTDSRFGHTIVACRLDGAKGLETIRHRVSSVVDLNSILKFGAELPESFLRGCGLQDEDIAYFRSRVGRPVRFYSCFISYSSDDEDFASRLHNDFQEAGIRCWKWDHDARTGRSLWGEIDQAIRVHNKLVLIASESSLKSPSVNREIERAIQREDQLIKEKNDGKLDGDTDVLFPVRVDDYIFGGWEHERRADVVKKVIADGCGWDRDPEVYKRVLAKLTKDLKPDAG